MGGGGAIKQGVGRERSDRVCSADWGYPISGEIIGNRIRYSIEKTEETESRGISYREDKPYQVIPEKERPIRRRLIAQRIRNFPLHELLLELLACDGPDLISTGDEIHRILEDLAQRIEYED